MKGCSQQAGTPGPLAAERCISPRCKRGGTPAIHVDAPHRFPSTWPRHVNPVIPHSYAPLDAPTLLSVPLGILQDRWIWRATLKSNVSKSPTCTVSRCPGGRAAVPLQRLLLCDIFLGPDFPGQSRHIVPVPAQSSSNVPLALASTRPAPGLRV